jgi:hypothetical protein
VIEQLLTQQQQQQQQGTPEQQYCLVSLAEGLLVLMNTVWLSWHGKRLVGKTLAPAVLPTTKMTLALFKLCGSSSSSSSSGSTAAGGWTHGDLASLEVDVFDMCFLWGRHVCSPLTTLLATELAGSSSSGTRTELLTLPALLQLLLLNLADNAAELHERQKGISPIAVPEAAAAAASEQQQQQEARQKRHIQVAASHEAVLAVLGLTARQCVSGRHRTYRNQIAAPAEAAGSAFAVVLMMLQRCLHTLVAPLQANASSSSSSSGNSQPLLPAQQVMPLLRMLVQLQLLAPELSLLPHACELMWNVCTLCTFPGFEVTPRAFCTQMVLPLLQECVLSVGPAVLSAVKHGWGDAEIAADAVVVRSSVDGVQRLTAVPPEMENRRQQALEWFGCIVGMLMYQAAQGCEYNSKILTSTSQ